MLSSQVASVNSEPKRPGAPTAWCIFGRLLILLMLICAAGSPWLYFSFAYAQGGAKLLLLGPDTSNFPLISVQIKPAAPVGQPEPVLDLAQLTVYENEKETPALSLEKARQGVNFSLVINGGRDLDIRDTEGISPYDNIHTVLADWASSRTSAREDDWSLFTHQGNPVRQSSDPEEWVAALAEYQPNFRMLSSDLTGLETAIGSSRERVVHFGVDKAVLFITIPPTPEQIIPLLSLAEEAGSSGIRVSVWLVGDPYFLTNDQGGALVSLAERTGGQFYYYNGIDPIPDPETYLAELGFSYALSYQSNLRETGTYPLRIEAVTQDGIASGESLPFYVQVLPPNPILLSPPTEISRKEDVESANTIGGLMPDQVKIEIMVEFPDGHPREIVASRLYVDGVIVDERKEAPFESLTWDLSSVTEPGEKLIQVAIEDVLGLAARTILTPVRVDVPISAPQPEHSMQTIGLLAAGLVLLATFLVLAYRLISRSWQRWGQPSLRMRLFSTGMEPGRQSDRSSETDRVTYARLIPLNAPIRDALDTAIPLDQPDMTFGCDPDRADWVLNNPDISNLHARIFQQDGSLWIKDLQSASGTWVNYVRIGTQPVQIKGGDLIHFGLYGFRFTMENQPSLNNVTITKYEPN